MAQPISPEMLDCQENHVALAGAPVGGGCDTTDPGILIDSSDVPSRRGSTNGALGSASLTDSEIVRANSADGEADRDGAVADRGYSMGRVPANKGRRYPPEVLAPAEVQALLDSCSLHPHTELRNRAFLTTLYRTGLRCSEALALEPKDVDFFNTSIRVLHGKGDRSRTVGIDPGALDIINEWIIERERRGFTRIQPLFCTRTGNPVPSSYVRQFIRQLGIEAGIAKRVHAHGFRHTHAYELMMEGIPVSIIQRQLGHSSLATTDTYLSHIAPQQVIDAIAGREWLAQTYAVVPPASSPLQALI
jgi:integrase